MILFTANGVPREVLDDICRVLAGVCSGSSETGDAGGPFCGHHWGMDVVGSGAGGAKLVVDCGGGCPRVYDLTSKFNHMHLN